MKSFMKSFMKARGYPIICCTFPLKEKKIYQYILENGVLGKHLMDPVNMDPVKVTFHLVRKQVAVYLTRCVFFFLFS